MTDERLPRDIEPGSLTNGTCGTLDRVFMFMLVEVATSVAFSESLGVDESLVLRFPVPGSSVARWESSSDFNII